MFFKKQLRFEESGYIVGCTSIETKTEEVTNPPDNYEIEDFTGKIDNLEEISVSIGFVFNEIKIKKNYYFRISKKPFLMQNYDFNLTQITNLILISLLKKDERI